MKRKLFSILSIASVLVLGLTACTPETISSSSNSASSNTSTSSQNVDQILSSDLQTLLTQQYYANEVRNASKIVYHGDENRGDTAIYTYDEEWTVYDDEVGYATGKNTLNYPDSDTPNSYKEDTYQHIVKTETISNQKVIYFVTDFNNDGAQYQNWRDDATRLPVYESEMPGLVEGSDYLAQGSVIGQINKQVSLIASNFIAVMLSQANGNIPYVLSYVKDGNQIYELQDFIFEVDDLKYTYTFLLTFDDDRIISAELHTSVDYGENYVITIDDTYTVSYDERTSFANSNIDMDPSNYFLASVSEVKGFYYDNGEKVYVDLNDVPVGIFLAFEASVYEPSLAVDLSMNAVESSNPAFVISGNVFEVTAAGRATLTIESQTGVVLNVSVAAGIPDVESITYTHATSDIELDYDSDDNPIYSIYVGQTYDSIYVGVEPKEAGLDNLTWEISDSSVLLITKVATYSTMIELEYQVLANNSSKSVTVTFKSGEVSYDVTYNIKDELTDEDRIAILMNTEYHWDSLYQGGSADLTFVSETTAHLRFYSGNEIIETDFTYSLNGSQLIVSNLTNPDYPYAYNSGDISLDCQEITLRVDVTAYVHYFYPVVEA